MDYLSLCYLTENIGESGQLYDDKFYRMSQNLLKSAIYCMSINYVPTYMGLHLLLWHPVSTMLPFMYFIFLSIILGDMIFAVCIFTRVSRVVTDHDDLLTQSRYIWVNIFWYKLLWQKLGSFLENKVLPTLKFSKNVNNKKCPPKIIFSMKQNFVKDLDNFRNRKLTLKVRKTAKVQK